MNLWDYWDTKKITIETKKGDRITGRIIAIADEFDDVDEPYVSIENNNGITSIEEKEILNIITIS